MKRLLNTAIGYFIAASAAGVFYREFTKWNGFTGKTTLGFVHTHLFVLGMFLFLILALTCKEEHTLLESKAFKRFYIIHNIALPFMAGMMVVRGILQVLNVNLTHAADVCDFRNRRSFPYPDHDLFDPILYHAEKISCKRKIRTFQGQI